MIQVGFTELCNSESIIFRFSECFYSVTGSLDSLIYCHSKSTLKMCVSYHHLTSHIYCILSGTKCCSSLNDEQFNLLFFLWSVLPGIMQLVALCKGLRYKRNRIIAPKKTKTTQNNSWNEQELFHITGPQSFPTRYISFPRMNIWPTSRMRDKNDWPQILLIVCQVIEVAH